MDEGVQQGGEYGYAVANAGDTDGDGYPELLVGAPKYELDVYREGVVMLYRGGAGGLAINSSWKIGGGQSGGRFGEAVAGAGDVNNDGYGDVLIGAGRYNNGQPEEGAVYLFLGSALGLAITPSWSFESDQAGAQLGSAVASAGDVNGDGYDDLLAGARWYTLDHSNEGAAFLFLGSETGPGPAPDWSAYGGQGGASFGSAVAGLGDVNADGYTDVVVGAPTFDADDEDEGAVFVYHGGPAGLAEEAAWTAYGGQEGAWFGAAVSGARDTQGDGSFDLLVGAPHADLGTPDEGAVYLYKGGPAGLAGTASWHASGGQTAGGFGIAVASAGDLNDDGFAEIVIGAHTFTDDQSKEGCVFVYPGGPAGPSSTPLWMASGNKAETEFGYTVSGVGDTNQDGYADFAVGAPAYRQNQTILGRAYLFTGSNGEVISTYLYLPVVRDG
jgi:hypothetical protein